MFHTLFATWMNLTHAWGLPGVFLMMAIESTVFPLPSELVVPPAAYWAHQDGRPLAPLVVVAALGSWFGSAISYAVARAIGRPLILRYGRYVFVPEKKWELAELWIHHFSVVGVFFARLLPVVRHLVSLPAGVARMRFPAFTATTLAGSLLWSAVLAWFGERVLGGEPRLLQDPDALLRVLKLKLLWFVGAAALLLALYVTVDLIGRRLHARRHPAA
ncbi:MAG TPA: DedA family protein [Candidatus Eisenbacteria bacterium]|nr:DedA family protein [Candidatus Eisenbacteria bacterium]